MTDNAELIARARTAAKNLRMWVATDCRIGAIRLEELVVALEAAEQACKDAARREQYPDTEADGVVFCGKCGMKR